MKIPTTAPDSTKTRLFLSQHLCLWAAPSASAPKIISKLPSPLLAAPEMKKSPPPTDDVVPY